MKCCNFPYTLHCFTLNKILFHNGTSHLVVSDSFKAFCFRN